MHANVTWGPDDHMVGVRKPVLLRAEEATVERCAFCGEPTIFGCFVRADPATVPFPEEEA